MNGTTFEFGDQVRHPNRPEWGVGAVMKSEFRPFNGRSVQFISVRFPGAGMKVINTSMIRLELIGGRPGQPSQPGTASTRSNGSGNGTRIGAEGNGRNGQAAQPSRPAELHEPNTMAQWMPVEESDWLAPIARRKIEEGMIALPEPATDPFRSVEQRLKATLDLYRFDGSKRALIEWATAQTGMADPLTRFSRHELEQFFERWRYERDLHLRRLVKDSEADPARVRELLKQARPHAKNVAKRHPAMR